MNEPRTITSLQHPLVKHLVKLRTDTLYRQETQRLMLEGVKPILELQSSLVRIFYTSSYSSIAQSLPIEALQITEGILKKISGMPNPEGIIAEVHLPPFGSLEKSSLVVAFDGISDPGNMGTLLRTALAFGWNTIYFLPNCCDPFNEKTLRAARGAHFKLSLVKGEPEQLKKWVEKNQAQALAAAIDGIPPESIPNKNSPGSPRLLVLGNEAHGITQAVKQFCTSITIPMPGQMESLNVAIAGGILLYVLSK